MPAPQHKPNFGGIRRLSIRPGTYSAPGHRCQHMSQMINVDETLKTIHQIMNANLSPRAKNLGIWIAVNRGIKSSELFWVKQAILAQDLNCSKSSIGRALRQLVNAKLLMDINQRHKGRYKFYRLNTELAQSPLVDRFLKEAGERWTRLFPALDGKSGRPALASCLNNLIGSVK